MLAPERAATTAKSAMSPSATGVLVPLSLPLTTVALMFFSLTRPMPSARAKVPISSPEAIFGSQACFWSSVPAAIRNSAAR